MSLRSDVLTVLGGGIPALIETPPQGSTAATDGARPEVIAPEPQLKDNEPFLMRVTQSQILLVTAAVLGVIGAVYVARKL